MFSATTAGEPNSPDMAALSTLQVNDVAVHFNGVRALEGVSLTLQRGQVLGVIGPNGAGKTTLVNVLTGLQKPTRGSVLINERNVNGLSANRVAREGVSRTFQAVRLFRNLSVRANVSAGAIGTGRSLGEADEITDEILDWLGLASVADKSAAALPYGDERLVGIARALAMRPRFLLLDEPAAGLNEAEADSLTSRVSAIVDKYGCGILLIEHNMRIVMRACQRLHVLDGGRTIATGDTDAVRQNPAVIEAYLGTRKMRDVTERS